LIANITKRKRADEVSAELKRAARCRRAVPARRSTGPSVFVK